MRELERRTKELENLKLQAEINRTNASTKREMAAADFIAETLSTITVETMSDSLKTLIIEAMVNPQGNDYIESQIKREIMGSVIAQEKEKTKQEEAKTESMKSQSTTDKTVSDQVVIDFKKRRKKDD